MGKFMPRVYVNDRVNLTVADLNNHPLAADYIEYIHRVKYPPDFKTYCEQQRIKVERKVNIDRERIAKLAAEPFCRSPLKRRRIS